MRLNLVPVLALAFFVPAPAWAQEATPSPASTGTSPAPASDCNGVAEIFAFPAGPVGAVGTPSTLHIIQVRGKPGTPVAVRWYSQPRPEETYQLVEGATIGSDGFFRSSGHRFSGNTRLFATDADGPDCAPISALRTIRAALSRHITAERLSPRRYTFSGFVEGNAFKVLNLHRNRIDGSSPPILTAQTRINGEIYTFDRTFLGSGVFDFFVSASDDRVTMGSITSFRRTVIY